MSVEKQFGGRGCRDGGRQGQQKKLSDTKSHSRKINLRRYTILQVTRASQWADRASEEQRELTLTQISSTQTFANFKVYVTSTIHILSENLENGGTG